EYRHAHEEYGHGHQKYGFKQPLLQKSPPLTRQDPGRAPDGGAHFLYRTIAKEKFSADYCKVYVKFRGGAAKKHPAGSPARSRYPVGMGKIKIRGSILTIPQSR